MDVFVDISGKQVRVKEGMVFSTFRLKDKKVGEQIELTPVCCIDENEIVTDGKKLKNIKVICDIVEEKKGEKIYSFKKKPKTGYKRGYGHRDRLMVLKVSKIEKK
ncbi:MAG: 50S ribosomal protein L21 [Candidatus Omnitrophica bacterium]|nr:50S ribosomal protein L21 [Candidatus Omnitrophota bacterium]MCM8777018.1 50S ribosomal protein L21 [Candidatus Omnitrophota bacterium]